MQITKPQNFKLPRELMNINENLDNIIKHHSALKDNRFYGVTGQDLKTIKEELVTYSDITVNSQYGQMYFNELNKIKDKLLRVISIIEQGV